MWAVLWQWKFPEHWQINPENVDFAVLWQNITVIKTLNYTKKINNFVDEITERINLVIKLSINDFTTQVSESRDNYVNLSSREEILLSEETTKLFNEMLLSALLFDEGFTEKMQDKKIDISKEVRLLYITDSLTPYKEKILDLLTKTIVQKRYKFF